MASMLKDYEKQDNLTSQKTKDRMTQGKGHVPQHRDKTRGRNTQTQAKINWRKFSETPPFKYEVRDWGCILGGRMLA